MFPGDEAANRVIWLMLAAMVLCTAICAVGAYLLGRKLPHSVSVVLAGLAVAGMLIFSRYGTDSVLVARMVPAKWLPVFGNWLPPLAGMMAGFSWVIGHRGKRTKIVLLGFFVALSMYLPYRRLFGPRPEVANQVERGVFMQTTDATCGAAAAATLLSTVGIESSEREMVDLCFSTWRGTSLHGIVRGLAVKLEGTDWRVRARKMPADELADLEAPAILEVGLQDGLPTDERYITEWGWIPGVVHTAVMFDVLPGGYLDIGDPTTGRERWRPEALEVLWQGVAITLERRK